MNTPHFFSFALLLLTTAACGSQTAEVAKPAGDGNVALNPNGQTGAGAQESSKSVGTVSGHAFTPQSTASAVTDGDEFKAVVLVASSQDDYCGNLAKGETRTNHSLMKMSLVSFGADGNLVAPTPGTYTVMDDFSQAAPGNYGLANFNVSDTKCEPILSEQNDTAISGTVTLTSVSSTSVAGSYDLIFPGGSLKGELQGNACASLLELVNFGQSGNDLVCVPQQ